MANETMLEELVETLKKENDWEKIDAPLTKGKYSLSKDGFRFNVYLFDLSDPCYRLSISGNGSYGYFKGELVKALYQLLVNRYGPIDTETLRKESEENTLKLALAKLRGE